MTVIEFGKRDLKINSLILSLIIVLVVLAVWGVFLYNKMIDLRHNLSKNQDALAKLQVQVAELKNQLDLVIGNASSPDFIKTTGLILDKNPSYFTLLRENEVVSQLVH